MKAANAGSTLSNFWRLHGRSGPTLAGFCELSKNIGVGNALLYMYDGKVCFPESAPYIDPLFDEFSAFPSGKYDDQVDSVSQRVATMANSLDFARQRLRPSNL
jgi:hypothetical protein